MSGTTSAPGPGRGRQEARGTPRRRGCRSAPEGRLGIPPASTAALTGLIALLLSGVVACDDQVKYVETFSTMTDGPAEQTYEVPPRPPVEGTVPVDGGTAPGYTVQEADTALTSPLQPTAATIERGRALYRNYCLTCHGAEGRGDGPAVNSTGEHPGRLPALPGADLTAERARGLSDGWIWGVITNGFSIMPSYERIPPDDRWYLVEYVRHLQQEAVTGEAGGDGEGSSADGSAGAAAAATPESP